MLVKNGTAFIGGHFTRADVRVENGKIAQIGDLQSSPCGHAAWR